MSREPDSPMIEGGWSAWENFNRWDVGGLLYPNLHLHGVGGFSSGELEELAAGGHDPKRKTFSAQAIEPGLSLRTKYFEAFANHLIYQDREGDWQNETEEYFGKIVGIPGGLELKGGRFLTHFGPLNDRHLHAWDFVDAELASSRFLGEHGLTLEGGQVAWTVPLGLEPTFTGILSLAFGNAPASDHEHHAHHEHGDGEEVPHDGEEAYPVDDVLAARMVGRHRFDDFHSVTAGLSWAGGDNGFGRSTNAFGIDAEYLWRENGLEAGGRAFRWRNEFLWREVDAFSQHDEDEDGAIDETFSGSYADRGFYSHAVVNWNQRWDTGLRLAWVDGVDDFGQSGRFRISPSVTWWLDPGRRIGLRTQYNLDAIDGDDDEHSVWFQLNIALGSTEEVR